MTQILKVFLILPFLICFAFASAVPEELAAYVQREEPESRWELVEKNTIGACDYWRLRLTSQVWKGNKWEHDLVVFLPQGVEATDKMVLLNEGGRFRPEGLVYGAMMATKMQAPFAILLGVPMQPLYGGKYEDDLIAETFVRYLETGDASWPLLFPMVKSGVRAMDAIQDFSGKEWEQPTESFLVTGASKRGWTAWLAAAADPRVIAIAPVVIDLLNIPSQLELQMERYGRPSKQVDPYAKRGLLPLGETERAKKLWRMVDPYSYREKLTMPKMILLGTNDPYWNTDALNLYWEEIPGENHISYTPNVGHDLREKSLGGKREQIPAKYLNNLAAFVRSQFGGEPLPEINWSHSNTGDGDYRIEVTYDEVPKQARLWVATSPIKDFRKARWESREVEVTSGEPVTATVEELAEGYIAFFMEVNYEVDEIPLWLATQMRFGGN